MQMLIKARVTHANTYTNKINSQLRFDNLITSTSSYKLGCINHHPLYQTHHLPFKLISSQFNIYI